MSAMDTHLTPFATLTPDTILTALDSVGLKTDGRLLALNSYENRVYQLGVEDSHFVIAKFYRPHRWTTPAILEEHALVQEFYDNEIPVVPAMRLNNNTLNSTNGFQFSVYPRQGGRVPEMDFEKLESIGRFLGRMHAIGALKSFNHRPTLDIESFGDVPRAYLLEQSFIPHELTAAYSSVSEQALNAVKRCFDRAGGYKSIRLHGDCYPGNLLWTDAGPCFVDFDDCRMGPAVQDLWMLLSGTREQMTAQLGCVIKGYRLFYDFDCRELHLLEALRTLRLIHYSAWLAQRWDDPAFPMAFPWFNTAHYWQNRILELREQVALMDGAPLQAYD